MVFAKALSISVYLVVLSEAAQPYWPVKSGNLNRTGLSAHTGPFDLSKPSWIFEEPDLHVKQGSPMKVFHQSPIMDEDFSVYITSVTGWMYKLDKKGTLLWSYEFETTMAVNVLATPALLDGVLYTTTADGHAWAIRATTGRKIWKVSVGQACPWDIVGVAAVGTTVLVATTPWDWNPEAHKGDSRESHSGAEDIVALDTKTGDVKWRYSVTKRSQNKVILYNAMPAIVNDKVFVDDFSGGAYCLSLEDGREIWHQPAPNPGTWSTGGMAVGPNNRMYIARNLKTHWGCNGDGMLRALDLETGKVIWERHFPGLSNNVGVAIGHLRPGGPLVVVAALGDNLSGTPVNWWDKPFEMYYLWKHKPKSVVMAMDAGTGHTIWALDLPLSSYAYSGVTWERQCFPDIFGNPSIGADGSVYVAWSGGKVFAIKDTNGDGQVSEGDRTEVSSYYSGFGSNGNPALAPGYMVAPTCNALIGFNI